MSEVDDLHALIAKGANHRERLDQWGDYFKGEFEPPYLPATTKTALSVEYADLMNRSNLNICGNAITAVTDRLRVDGYRTTAGAVDALVWSWWQANSLDARQRMVYQDAMVYSNGWVLVTPPTDVMPGVPRITVEYPKHLHVMLDEADPMTPMMAAKVLKRRAWLYYPDRIVALMKERYGGPWVVMPDGVVEHAAGVVPVVRFANRLDSEGDSESELAQIAPVQRRINQTIFDRMMLQKWATWKQRYVAGIDVEKDENGKALPPFRVGVDQLLVAPNADTKFGEFSESSIAELLRAVDDDIRHAAAITQTPPHLLAPSTISNISAEALVALEAGLSSKVFTRQGDWGESWERVMLIAGRIVGVDVPMDAEMVWANLEARSQAQIVDSVIKLKSIGLPMSYLLERLGLTPQQAVKILDDARAEASQAAAVSAAAFGIAPNANADGV